MSTLYPLCVHIVNKLLSCVRAYSQLPQSVDHHASRATKSVESSRFTAAIDVNAASVVVKLV